VTVHDMQAMARPRRTRDPNWWARGRARGRGCIS
jgi:hypothetical protein